MERSIPESEMKCIPLVLFGASFLRPILKEHRMCIEEGIVLVADNENQAKQFVSAITYQIQNFKKISSWNSRSDKIDNYCCAILMITRTTKSEEVEKLLSEDAFLPVVIVGGIMPEYLRNRMYVFRISQSEIDFIRNDEFEEVFKKFRSHIIDNVPAICKSVKKFPTSIVAEDFTGSSDMKGIYSVMAVIGYLYAKFLRTNQSEREVIEFLQRYIDECKERVQLIPEFYSGMDLPETLSSLVWEYCDNESKMRIVDIQNITGAEWALYCEKKAIFYDENFYYFSPDMFRLICKPLLQTVSQTELKRQLKQNDIIFCQSGDYTIKKTIVNAYGQVERPRMIWVRREFLCSPDNYWLEDIFG